MALLDHLVSQLQDVTEPARAQGHLPLDKGPRRTGMKDPRDAKIRALAEALKTYTEQLQMIDSAFDILDEVEDHDNPAGTYSTDDYVQNLNRSHDA